MKKIAITQRLIKNKNYKETREALDIKYCEMIHSCGFIPVILPYEINFKKYFENIGINGVILSSGNDLYIFNKNELSKKRDKFEKKLLKYCIESKIPVFGICRGMQLIADFFGSTFKRVSSEVKTKSNLVVNESSIYSKYLKKFDKVNSYHNFTIKNLNNSLIISSINERQVIKSIEHSKHKIFGQMWHSERELKFDKRNLNLIKNFFK